MARLRFYPDERPGFTRRRAGRSYAFYDCDSGLIRDADVRARILGLGIPPAWTDVWISPHANGHLQATGRDAKGRKQYRYHTDWSQARSETKYANLAGFGEGLADLRRWISAHLRPDQAGSRDFAIAAVLALIDRSSIRVGNEAYTRENGSFGATTLKPAHVEVEGSHIRLAFTAKGGKQVERQLTGRKLARVLHQLSDLPGGDLFTWLDEDGEPCVVTSEMVNDTIRAVFDITPGELRELIDAGKPVALIDVREQVEWDINRIEGAELIPKSTIEAGDGLAKLPHDRIPVLYCKTGVRSAEALAAVKKAGFSDALHLQGGIVAWAKQLEPDMVMY